MKIKAKLTLGVGLLFALIVLLAFFSIRQLYILADDTKNILTDNYNSLDYGQSMLLQLEPGGSIEELEHHLANQEANITEPGEAGHTAGLRKAFEQMKDNPNDTLALQQIRHAISNIMKINLDAIQRKSAIAEHTATNGIFWLSVIGTLCFIIAFILLFNLPANIADPIQELTVSIRQVAEGDYEQRVHFRSGSEFGELARSFNVMAEKLQVYNNSSLARLMTEKKRIETLINTMHDPVIGLDERNKIIFINAEALKISGLQLNEVLGKSILEIAVTNDLLRTLTQHLLAEKEGKEAIPRQPLVIYANNKESYFEKEILNIEAIPTGEKTPLPLGHVIMLRNITAYKEMDTAKTNFIATISHEFKTPISSIKMSLQLLENPQTGTLNPDQQHLLHSIQEDTGRLLKITSELLNMTQVETGNIQLSVVPSDAGAMLLHSVKATENQALNKKIKIHLNISEVLPLAMADSNKTTWVLTNLIANAIQYSYENAPIFLRIYTLDNQVCFEIKDTGQGIAPQDLNRVFDRYFRVPGAFTEGTGLGLSIAREFVEAQGGTILAESEFGAGSVFTVKLASA